VDKLRHAGIAIHGEVFTGYRLVRLPDVLLTAINKAKSAHQTDWTESVSLLRYRLDKSFCGQALSARTETSGGDRHNRGITNCRPRPSRANLAFGT
jgi:hypothetical protein